MVRISIPVRRTARAQANNTGRESFMSLAHEGMSPTTAYFRRRINGVNRLLLQNESAQIIISTACSQRRIFSSLSSFSTRSNKTAEKRREEKREKDGCHQGLQRIVDAIQERRKK
jgi:hypothetical protein